MTKPEDRVYQRTPSDTSSASCTPLSQKAIEEIEAMPVPQILYTHNELSMQRKKKLKKINFAPKETLDPNKIEEIIPEMINTEDNVSNDNNNNNTDKNHETRLNSFEGYEKGLKLLGKYLKSDADLKNKSKLIEIG